MCQRGTRITASLLQSLEFSPTETIVSSFSENSSHERMNYLNVLWFFFSCISITYIFSKARLGNQYQIFSLFELLFLFMIFCCSKSSDLVCVSSNFALAENNF